MVLYAPELVGGFWRQLQVTMKKETRDRILHAYDEAFRLLACEDFAQGIRYICSEMEGYLKQLRHARTRTSVEAMLTKEPEPDTEKLEAIVEAIRLLPYQLRKALPRAAKEAAQELPRPRGGRPRLLTPEDCKHACAEIGKLYAKSVSLPDVQMRVAQKLNVSVRTIQRAWQNRAKPTFVRDE